MHPKVKMHHPQVVSNPYDFHFLVKDKGNILNKNCVGLAFKLQSRLESIKVVFSIHFIALSEKHKKTVLFKSFTENVDI